MRLQLVTTFAQTEKIKAKKETRIKARIWWQFSQTAPVAPTEGANTERGAPAPATQTEEANTERGAPSTSYINWGGKHRAGCPSTSYTNWGGKHRARCSRTSYAKTTEEPILKVELDAPATESLTRGSEQGEETKFPVRIKNFTRSAPVRTLSQECQQIKQLTCWRFWWANAASPNRGTSLLQ